MADLEEVTWPRPPPEGFTASDLDAIPGLPEHVELIDGALVFPARQYRYHSHLISLLSMALDEQAPEHLHVVTRMSVWMSKRQRPEPDLSLIRDEGIRDLDQTWFPVESVELVVEIVSGDSDVRDRVRKPQLYAEAGIPHFWRVEWEDGEAVVHVYELDSAHGGYDHSCVQRQRLRLSRPFDIDIDLDLTKEGRARRPRR
jgi:Uma2 family endonuclease